ncbi:glutamine synthetase family protein [Streptomyces sp. NBC_00481]|uniref:glutamine synthetase family protein n=1 Tax=unclassified Streptomyces TaxID=2593676 RepID=UPI002DDA2C07|nr:MULTISPECIES: glutamine synthetase family protein [unclassified Streptomyces]WRZ00427.1 glutamine synthetase family protein [Streptomyces sp. NBC_00481]
MTAQPLQSPMPLLPRQEQDAFADALAAAGTRRLVGSVVDMAGVARAKTVSISRAQAFHSGGLGASPTWNVFCIDNTVAVTDRLGVVGDLRLRADLRAARILTNGYAWAPAEMFDQHGRPWPGCARGHLRSVQARAQADGLSALVGNELEFVVTAADRTRLPGDLWQAYGLGPTFTYEAFLADLAAALDEADLKVEQLHAEAADYQFELSLAPAPPLEAADSVVLARLVIGRVARRHGLLVSFSPLPFPGAAGNGAHQHLSLSRDRVPLLSGGDGPHGLTADGAAAVAGIVAGLPETLAVFAGSVLSAHRLQPGRWSGAFACWGLENREAAVRFCAATPGNPHGANVELKCVDPSGNPYLTVGTMLGLALHGLAERTPLPPEVTRDPALLDPAAAAAASVVPLAETQADMLAALRSSALAERLLGSDIFDALLAVREHEAKTYDGVAVEELARRFRYAWSF